MIISAPYSEDRNRFVLYHTASDPSAQLPPSPPLYCRFFMGDVLGGEDLRVRLSNAAEPREVLTLRVDVGNPTPLAAAVGPPAVPRRWVGSRRVQKAYYFRP